MTTDNTGTDHDEGGAYFRTELESDPVAEAATFMRMMEAEIFGDYAHGWMDIDDLEVHVESLARSTGWGRQRVTKGIFAYKRLDDLPLLREMQEVHHRLDLGRLIAIDETLNQLGPDAGYSVMCEFDLMLCCLLDPQRPAQELPSPRVIKERIKKLIASMDAGIAHDEEKREEREKKGNAAKKTIELTVSSAEEVGRAAMTLSADSTTITALTAVIEKTARELKLGKGEAARQIILGETDPALGAKLYGFVALDATGAPVPGESIYFPRFGWTDAIGNEAFESLVAEEDCAIVNLLDVADQETEAYVPTESMRAYVIARDGTCIWPGCGMAAERCQLDHRVPFDEGGKTTPNNLFALCQHHHNLKTQRRATYIPDPESGEIVWLFNDGTYSKVMQDGFLYNQLSTRTAGWGSTSLAEKRREIAVEAEFLARGHAILDACEEAADEDEFWEGIKALQALEKEYERFFPFDPVAPEGVEFEPWDRLEQGPTESVR
ncbi:HNH endonuclease signature motif containing protein [Corynebacterium aquatimens]|uniref:HNH nuclease domain-containing protein n=1 Tax=Corynebacterium aquatimens TaxID=1190508 RepID=A0A931E521_9CORY|nr:HNH endonuclease signature motif containing protein [Corynebacterium aquatimens]MBG6122568.1 hypothetical protein [Corynebacterium aquatimens]WJY64892.1 HNH endonuclease [Corynebacterium aquatimens]